jgi:tetrahydromethanopterin S-methyltransferase subunit D
VNTPTGRRQGGPPAAAGRAVRTGTGIFLIAAGADLRFAVAAGSPHGLNVHFVGVVLILAGVLCSLLPLLLSLLFTGVNAAFFGLSRTVAGELLGAPGRRADLKRRSSAPVQP